MGVRISRSDGLLIKCESCVLAERREETGLLPYDHCCMESDGQGTGEVLLTLLATLCLRVGRHLSYLLVRIHKTSSNHASSVSLSPDEPHLCTLCVIVAILALS